MTSNRKTEKPGAVAAATGPLVKVGSTFTTDNTQDGTRCQAASFPVVWISRRFAVSPHMAAILAPLAGFKAGGAND